MNVPSKPTLRTALELITVICEESLETTRRLPARASFIEPLASGYERILAISKTTLGGRAWGGKKGRVR